MELRPATLDQVSLGHDGRFVHIDADVGAIARRLQELDPQLHLRYSEAGGYFVVYRVIERADGSTKKDMVTTAQELDGRLLQRVEEVYGRDYDYGTALMKADDEAKRAADHKFDEHHGELAEKLAHAMRKDLGVKPSKIVVPRSL